MNFSETIRLLITANTGGAVTPLNNLGSAAEKADKSIDKVGKTSKTTGDLLKKGLVAGATALVGTGLVKFLSDSVKAYGDAAKAAGDLASATGGSVEEVSRMTAALEDAGVSAEQTAGLLTKFTTSLSTEKGVTALHELNVELVKGKDGATDYAGTMVKAIDAIGEIGDASERNRQLVNLFGKQGAKAFQDLYGSGIKLSEAMKLVSKYRVFTADDVARAGAYDDAMDSLHASIQQLQFSLGRTLIPLVSTGAGVLADLVNVLSAVPTEIYLVVGAIVAYQKIASSAFVTTQIAAVTQAYRDMKFAQLEVLATTASLSRAQSMAAHASAVGDVAAEMEANALAAQIELNKAEAAQKTAAGRFKQGMSGIFSPMNVALASITIAWIAIDKAIAGAQDNLEAFSSTSDVITDETAKKYNESLSLFEKWGLDVKDFYSNWTNYLGPRGFVSGLKKGWDEIFGGGDINQRRVELEKHQEEARKAAEAEGAFSVAALESKDSTEELNQAMAGFLFPDLTDATITQEELADKTLAAAEAAYKQETATKAVRDAMDAAIVTADELAEATLAAFSADIAHERAKRDRRDAVAEAIRISKDEKASNDDVAESILKVREASLQTAQAYVEEATARREAAGEFVSESDKRTMLIESLNRQITALGESKALEPARESLKQLVKDLEGAEVGPLSIDGVRFKEGTTDEVVADLKAKIQEALAKGDTTLAATLQADLDALKIPPMPVTLTDANGNPLTEAQFTLGVDTSEATTALTTLKNQIATAVQVEFNAIVTNEANTRNVITGLATPSKYTIEYNTDVTNDDNTENVLKGLADPKVYRIEYNTVVTNEQNTRNVLNGLDGDRTVYYDVVVRGSAAARRVLDSIKPPATVAATSAAPVIYQTNNISVPGSGSPAVTAREIDRYLRKAGNPSLVSVS